MGKKKSAAQKAKAAAAAAQSGTAAASEGQSVDPSDYVKTALSETKPEEVPAETEAPAKKKRNRRGKQSRKKATGSPDETGDEDAAPPQDDAAPREDDEWVAIDREEADEEEEAVAPEKKDKTGEEDVAAPTPTIAEECDEDERVYLLSGRKIHAPDSEAEDADSDDDVDLDDLNDDSNDPLGSSGDGTEDEEEKGSESGSDDAEDEEEDETAEVLELLVDEFVQRHGRLPRDDEVGQWRDAMASAAPTSSALLGEEASEEAMLSAEEAMHASASSDESNSAASDSSGDADQGGESLRMSRRLSANQIQMLLSRGDLDEDMASEDDSEEVEDGEEGSEEEEGEGGDGESGEGSGELTDVKPLMSRRLSANQIQMLLSRGDLADSDEAEGDEGSSGGSSGGGEGSSGVDDGVGAWPKERAVPRSAEARRERYAVALMVLGKLKSEAAVGAHEAGVLKEMALVDDEQVMGPVGAFLADDDLEALTEELHSVAVNAASMA